MIQRIQTVYLAIAGLLTASLLKFRLAEIAVGGSLYTFSAKGIFNGENTVFNGLPVMVAIGLIAIIHFVIIAMYKKRMRQMRLAALAIVFLLALCGTFAYLTFAGENTTQVALGLPSVFPMIAIIFDFLAMRAIRKDEALVRSLNRLR